MVRFTCKHSRFPRQRLIGLHVTNLASQPLDIVAGKISTKDGKAKIDSSAIDSELIQNVLDHDNGPASGLPYQVRVMLRTCGRSGADALYTHRVRWVGQGFVRACSSGTARLCALMKSCKRGKAHQAATLVTVFSGRPHGLWPQVHVLGPPQPPCEEGRLATIRALDKVQDCPQVEVSAIWRQPDYSASREGAAAALHVALLIPASGVRCVNLLQHCTLSFVG